MNKTTEELFNSAIDELFKLHDSLDRTNEKEFELDKHVQNALGFIKQYHEKTKKESDDLKLLRLNYRHLKEDFEKAKKSVLTG